MDLNETLAFVAVVKAGSFTAAGKRLGVPKSTISRQVKRLEDRLGVRLLHRTTRSLTTTEVGRAYFEEAERGVRAVETAEAMAHDAANKPRGVLRIAAPMNLEPFYGPLGINGFLHKYPEVRLEVVQAQRAVDLVAEGFDVALRGGPRLPDSNLVVQSIARAKIKFYASPDYIAREGAPGSAAELALHPLLIFAGYPLRDVVRSSDFGKEAFPSGLQPRVSVNSFDTLARLAAEGHGIAAIIDHHARPLLEAGEIQVVLPDLDLDGGALYALYPSSRLISPKVRVFVDHIVAAGRAWFGAEDAAQESS